QVVQAELAPVVEERPGLEDGDGPDVDGRVRPLQPQEAGVEGGQPVDGAHAAPPVRAAAGPARRRRGRPTATTSSNPCSRHAAMRSGSSTAARSQARAMQAVRPCDRRVTLRAAPVGGAKAQSRSTRAPARYGGRAKPTRSTT